MAATCPLSIRSERPEDEAAICAVHLAAFPTAAESRLVDRLRVAGRAAIWLLVERDGQVVGHILFSPVTVEPLESNLAGAGLGLAPVAVLPDWQRRGIGGRLIEAGLAAARREHFAFVVVLGEPEYYRRFGFLPASRWKLTSQYDAGDAFMAQELVPGGLSGAAGLVEYTIEFDEL